MPQPAHFCEKNCQKTTTHRFEGHTRIAWTCMIGMGGVQHRFMSAKPKKLAGLVLTCIHATTSTFLRKNCQNNHTVLLQSHTYCMDSHDSRGRGQASFCECQNWKIADLAANLFEWCHQRNPRMTMINPEKTPRKQRFHQLFQQGKEEQEQGRKKWDQTIKSRT